MKMIVINLDRRPDRLQKFRDHNGDETIERFSACTGPDPSRPCRTKLKNSEIGIIRSNLAIYRKFPEEPHLTIFEDDAILRTDFVARAEQQIGQLPHDWHFIMWGWNFDCYLVFDPMGGVAPCVAYFSEADFLANVRQFAGLTTPILLHRLFRCHGIPGYSISRLGISLIQQELEKMEYPLDMALNNIYPRLNAYVSFPPLVVTENCQASSDIQKKE